MEWYFLSCIPRHAMCPPDRYQTAMPLSIMRGSVYKPGVPRLRRQRRLQPYAPRGFGAKCPAACKVAGTEHPFHHCQRLRPQLTDRVYWSPVLSLLASAVEVSSQRSCKGSSPQMQAWHEERRLVGCRDCWESCQHRLKPEAFGASCWYRDGSHCC